MFRVRLREESTMRISEPADLDLVSLNLRVLSESEEKWSGRTCAEKCPGEMTETIQRKHWLCVWRVRGSYPAREVSLMRRSYFPAPAQPAAGKRGKVDLTEERKARQSEGERMEKRCIPGRPLCWETVRLPMQVLQS